MERKKASDFPQELLNLFDQYVHGDIGRRDFFDGAQKFAVGGLTAAAICEALRPNYAWAQQVAKDDKRIKAGYETVQSPAGQRQYQRLSRAPGEGEGKLPGVLVIHENRGLNPYIEDVARRLGTANFVAFAPDGLTTRGRLSRATKRRALKLFATVDKPKMMEDFIAAAKWLKARPDCNGKIGVVGFCFGGGMVNTLAVRMGSISPRPCRSTAASRRRRVPRRSRRRCCSTTPRSTRASTGWPAYEEALKANHVTYTVHMYEGANHGFHNDTTPRYDEAAAKLAWQRTLDFFNKYLRA